MLDFRNAHLLLSSAGHCKITEIREKVEHCLDHLVRERACTYVGRFAESGGHRKAWLGG